MRKISKDDIYKCIRTINTSNAKLIRLLAVRDLTLDEYRLMRLNNQLIGELELYLEEELLTKNVVKVVSEVMGYEF